MGIKSYTEVDLLSDIEETYRTLKSINMKLNQKKCSFGVEEGKFLGHMITKQGIKANPKKIHAIQAMASPTSIVEVQSLNGKLPALSRFLSRAADRSIPFFKKLKGCMDKKNFKWTPEAEGAFQKIKGIIEELPTLTLPSTGKLSPCT